MTDQTKPDDLMPVDYDDLQPGVSADEQVGGLRRLGRLLIGILLVAAGTVMLVIPGPGIVTILVGLNLIKPDNALVRWLRRKTPGIPEDGSVPTRFVVIGAVFLIGGTILGLLLAPRLGEIGPELIGLLS